MNGPVQEFLGIGDQPAHAIPDGITQTMGHQDRGPSGGAPVYSRMIGGTLADSSTARWLCRDQREQIAGYG